MKRVLSLLLLTILVVGCSQRDPTPPELTIMVDNKSISAVLGTYSWKNTEADSVSPPELVEYQKEDLNIKPQSSIILKFERTPNHYEVFIWQGDKRILQQTSNGVVIAPQQKGLVVYEIYAKWHEGSAHYAFSVNVE
ncbi:hypothetical protein [Caldicoprobacter faecalis]|uniref:Lipoprotein n=1 Tax=Caldicoprobacter faecalis TaxID=937334 RepID=A0A1I5SV74_9FIRM|nr:hypothetical protein [Caldicoprobacter faecalis]PZN07498.1 MAG: hypothetical protein DIU64_12285 [Caldicoprobacter oshimai]SFP74126.1 hypothetical protein SAMN05444406_10352 [Caldicoprobacter faecalis]